MRKCPMRCSLKPDSVLLILTVVSVILGVSLGVAVKYSAQLSARQLAYLNFPGDLFLRMLKMLILPLIVCTLINSLSSLDTQAAGRLGFLACSFYLLTTIIAVILGIVLVVSIKPGTRAGLPVVDEQSSDCDGTVPGDTIMDLIRNMFPDNLVQATFQSQQTCYTYSITINGNQTMSVSYKVAMNLTAYGAAVTETPITQTRSGMNILGLIVFCIVFGGVLGRYKQECHGIIAFFAGLEFAIMKIVKMVIWLSPIGILFLIAAQIAKMTNLLDELERLSWYMLTVLVGLCIHAVIIEPLLLFLLGRKNPIKYMVGVGQALLTAFGTASSSATLPLTLQCLEDNNKIDTRVTRFMIPLGATINMDGTALYEAVAAIYIAQTTGVSLNFGEIIIVSLTATLASIGAAGIPQAGLVTMIMVLISVGLNPKYFVLIVPIDWLLDRFRTMVNVWGDCVGAGVVDTHCKLKLPATPGTNSKLELIENGSADMRM